jgi:hypothetical protein
MTTTKIPTASKIQKKFISFRKRMRDIWKSYNIINFYIPILHEKIVAREIETLDIKLLLDNQNRKHNIKHTVGALAHLRDSANPRRTLIDSVGVFENYLGSLATFVYSDYPEKLSSQTQDSSVSQEMKIIDIILSSTDRNEIINKIIEEKIRGIFYGNPIDFFMKDKGRLQFGSYFKDNCSKSLDEYREILARRNILIHNNGRIDRKYLREIKGSLFMLNQSVPIPMDYLRSSISLMEGLAAISSSLVIKNIYKQDPKGILGRSYHYFTKEYPVLQNTAT